MKINVLNPLIERNNRMRKEQYIQSCCTGCGLCHAVYGTEISKDEKGFIRPENIRGGYWKHSAPRTYIWLGTILFPSGEIMYPFIKAIQLMRK